jgi:hypothetical protein
MGVEIAASTASHVRAAAFGLAAPAPPAKKGRARSLAAPPGFHFAISTRQRPQNLSRSAQTCPPEQA